jgi:lipopolysaccharide export system permease protein
MRRITRYVLFDLLIVFGVTLTGMTLLMMLVGVAQEAIRQGLGPVPILRLLPYVVPNALRFAVPGTILFAACTVYGRMAAANEVVAVKSLGISPMTLIWPALILAFVLSLTTVWLNDIAVSWGRTGIQRVIIQSVEQIAYGMLRTQRSYSNRRFSINVKRVDGKTLVLPTIIFQASGDSPPITLTAQEAELRFNPETNLLLFSMKNGSMDVGGQASLVFTDTFQHEVPLSDSSRDDMAGGPSDCPLWRIPREIASQRQEIERLEQSLAASAAYEMLTGDFDALAGQSWDARHAELKQARERLFRLQTEPWRRWANGFSCLCFVLVGVPLAIRLRNADIWTSFALCFLPILVIYYPLLAFGVDRAKSGDLPPYAVWLGNVILVIVGYWMLRKVMRY